MKKHKYYITIFLITLFVVLFVRAFLVQSYTVSSSQMETALLKGDRVFVDKTSYGVRTPITLLSIPFTFNSFLGLKSYSSLIELNYNRFFAKDVKRNDIILFNNPIEIDKPIDKRSLALSRCVAIFGDTIKVDANDFFINGKKYIPSPDLLMTFRFPIEKNDSISSILGMFNIPYRSSALANSVWGYVRLNRYEVFIVNQKLSAPSQLIEDINSEITYNLIVPTKGLIVDLNKFNVPLYGQLIEQECEAGSIVLLDSEILKNGLPLTSYEFTENYYWLISDNQDDSTDSRSLGFVSEKYIIGKVSYIWFSSAGGGINWRRSFSVVN